VSNIIPIATALGKPVRRTAFFTVYASGRLQYTEAGRNRFGPRFERWGVDIRSIRTSEDHFSTIANCEDLELTAVIESGPEVRDPTLTEEFINQLLESADRKDRQSIRGIVRTHRLQQPRSKEDHPTDID
jgi:hypothetical protein